MTGKVNKKTTMDMRMSKLRGSKSFLKIFTFKLRRKKVSGGIWKLNFACHNEYHLYLALKISKEKMMLT